MKKTICAIAVGLIAIMGLTACKTPTGNSRPHRSEAAEYDCHKNAKDHICEVPWKDKVVLYCYKGAIPKVVRYREECK